MRFNYLVLALFFVVVFFLGYLVVPGEFDLVAVYRNDEDFSKASSLINKLQSGAKSERRVLFEEAKILIAQGQNAKARPLISDLINLKMNTPEFWTLVRDFGYASFDPDLTQLAYERLLRFDPLNAEYLQELLGFYRVKKDFKKGIPILRRLIRVRPDLRGYQQELYTYYLQSLDLDRAAGQLYTYIDRFPEDADATELLIDLLRYQGKHRELIAVNRKVLSRSNDPELLLEQAKLLGQTSQFDESRQYFERISGLESGQNILMELGEDYVYRKHAAALSLYRWMHEKYPGNDAIFHNLMFSYVQAGRDEAGFLAYRQRYFGEIPFKDYHEKLLGYYYEDALRGRYITRLKALVRLRPTYENRLALAGLMAIDGDYRSAAEQTTFLLLSVPEDQHVHQQNIVYLEGTDQRFDLLNALDTYDSKWPGDKVYQEKLVQTYEWVGDYRSALRYLDPLYESEPDNLTYIFHWAMIHTNLKRFDSAVEAFEILAESNYRDRVYSDIYLFAAENIADVDDALRHAEVLNEFTYGEDTKVLLFLASLLEKKGEIDQATEIYSYVVEQSPDADTFARLGWYYMEKKDDDDRAAYYFDRALQLDPNNRITLLGAAEAWKKRDRAKALRFLDRLFSQRQLDPDNVYIIAGLYEDMREPAQAKRAYQRFLFLTRNRSLNTLLFIRQKARASYVVGQKETAFRVLTRAKEMAPHDREIANDLAQLHIENGRYHKVLGILEPFLTFTFLSDPSIPDFEKDAENRTLSLHLQAYNGLQDWENVRATLKLLEVYEPGNVDIKLDIIRFLDGQGEWDQALDEVWRLQSSIQDRYYLELLFEMENGLRVKREKKWDYQVRMVSLDPANYMSNMIARNIDLSPFSRLAIRAVNSQYDDPGVAFRGGLSELHLDLRTYLNPRWYVNANVGYFFSPHKVTTFGLDSAYRAADGFFVSGEFDMNDKWEEPLKAVDLRGTVDKIVVTVVQPFLKKWYVRASAAFRQYKVFVSQLFATQTEQSVAVGRAIYETEYGDPFPLRYASIEVGMANRSTSPTGTTGADIPLILSARPMTIGLFGHFLLSPNSLLDVSLFVGQDSRRGIAFGESLGVDATYKLKLNKESDLMFRAQYFTESPTEASDASYLALKFGLHLKL